MFRHQRNSTDLAALRDVLLHGGVIRIIIIFLITITITIVNNERLLFKKTSRLVCQNIQCPKQTVVTAMQYTMYEVQERPLDASASQFSFN